MSKQPIATPSLAPRWLDRHLVELTFVTAGAVLLSALFSSPWVVSGILLAAVAALWVLARGRSAIFGDRDQLITTIAALKTQLQTRTDDPDTGLGTFPDLQACWAVAVARARRRGEAFSLVLLEVARGFRADAPLTRQEAAAVAERVRNSKRTEDSLFRLDTWTFAILLAGSDAAGAEAFMTRIRGRVASQPVRESHVSVVAKAAAWQPGHDSLMQHLHAADSSEPMTQAGARTPVAMAAGADAPAAFS